MTTKHINFLTTIWFISVLICIIMEGTYFSSSEQSILNHLRLFKDFHFGTLFSIPVFNLGFVQGIYDILTWRYSFYSDEYVVLRWFWTAVLSPGAVYGLVTMFIGVWSQLVSLFRLLPAI
jgi:hypothetical protein